MSSIDFRSLVLREDGYNVHKSSVECLFPVHRGKTTQPRPMGQVSVFRQRAGANEQDNGNKDPFRSLSVDAK